MQCQNCNKEIGNDSNFCFYCGFKIKEDTNKNLIKQGDNDNMI